MTVSVPVWRIGTDAPTYASDDLSGEGSKQTGGRWNRKGVPVVYASQSVALACLETLVHINASGLPLNRYLVRIDIPIDVWRKATRLEAASLPIGWDATPTGKVSLDIGDQWLASNSSSLLIVASAIVPQEHNVLINPSHPDTASITATKVSKWLYDSRLL
jgi:RES domain-containing protein